jgi:hypothetical protein
MTWENNHYKMSADICVEFLLCHVPAGRGLDFSGLQFSPLYSGHAVTPIVWVVVRIKEENTSGILNISRHEQC